MSGMFQRIARRRADRSEEPGAADAVDATTVAEAAAETSDAPTIVTPPLSLGDGAPEAPTERIPPVVGLAPHELTTATPPATPPSGEATTPEHGEATEPQGGEAGAQQDGEAAAEPAPRRAGFRARGRMRRRLRYLRNLRELQVRDLGGLVFDLRRFERKRDDLVAQKIDRIRACDDELRALEHALDERRELHDVREPGIGGTCPRCFAVHGSADRFCASCGAALGGAVQGPAQVPAAPPPAPATPAQPPSAPPQQS